MTKEPVKLPEKLAATQAGVVGLGLMGTSIVTCLLAAGHKVTGLEKTHPGDGAFGGALGNFSEKCGAKACWLVTPDRWFETFALPAITPICGIVELSSNASART